MKIKFNEQLLDWSIKKGPLTTIIISHFITSSVESSEELKKKARWEISKAINNIRGSRSSSRPISSSLLDDIVISYNGGNFQQKPGSEILYSLESEDKVKDNKLSIIKNEIHLVESYKRFDKLIQGMYPDIERIFIPQISELNEKNIKVLIEVFIIGLFACIFDPKAQYQNFYKITFGDKRSYELASEIRDYYAVLFNQIVSEKKSIIYDKLSYAHERNVGILKSNSFDKTQFVSKQNPEVESFINEFDIKNHDFLVSARRLYYSRNEKTPIFLLGETGVGKSTLAKELHDLSYRKEKVFNKINLAATPETLIASELFGSVRGAYSDAKNDKDGIIKQSNGGTLFIDEITNAPLNVQQHLLLFLDDGKIRKVGGDKTEDVDVKLIFASNLDPDKMFKENKIKEDFFYRISRNIIIIPPLRYRVDIKEKILEVFKKIVNKLNEKHKANISEEISYDLMSILLYREWKGNFRELEAVLENAVLDSIMYGEPSLSLDYLRRNVMLYNQIMSWQNTDLEVDKTEKSTTLENRTNPTSARIGADEILNHTENLLRNLYDDWKAIRNQKDWTKDNERNLLDGLIKPTLASLFFDEFEEKHEIRKKDTYREMGMAGEQGEKSTINRNHIKFQELKKELDN